MIELISEQDIARRVDELADELSSIVSSEWTVVQLLQGAAPFAVDLMRALARRDIHPILDSLWLESYRDGTSSSGAVVIRADISRPIDGRSVLVLDDVFDSGLTIAYARAHLAAKGANGARACAFVRKPSASRDHGVEHVGFDAPDRFLVGYGMDLAGRYRGLPYVACLD